MKKNLAVAITLGALTTSIIVAPTADAAPCRKFKAPGCSTSESDDSPMDPRSVKSAKTEPHKAGNPSDPNTGHPPIRFRRP